MARAQHKAGCFVLLTNALSEGPEEISSRDLLFAYKDQGYVERNFGFLKDTVIVNSLFLKSPERIEALGAYSGTFAARVAPHGENHEDVSSRNGLYDNRMGQETNISPYIVHDDHIFSVGAGDPNHRRKDAGKAPEAYPAKLSGYTGAVSSSIFVDPEQASFDR